MPIDFLDLLDGDGWEPASLDPDEPGHRWTEIGTGSDGGSLAAAPVDVAATFDGAVWHSTRIDPDFGLLGVRLRAGFVVPRCHHSEDVQRIVFGGSVTIHHDEGEATVGPGQFFLVQAETPYVLVAGPDGVTYTESWPLKSEPPETCWYPGPEWVAR